MGTPYVTNRVTALAMKLGPLKTTAFRSYNYAAKYLNRTYTAKTYFGSAVRCDPRDYIQRMIFSFGFWEPHVSAYIEEVLKPGDTFVDVGANIGYHSLLAAQLVGSQGSVVAVEAAPATFALLQKNLEINRCDQVLAMNIAASDEYSQVNLFGDECLATTTTIPNRDLPLVATIPCAPLSSIIPVSLLKTVRLVKIDIEGGEIPVMKDLSSNRDRFSPDVQVIAEASMAESKTSWAEILNKMRERGFTAYKIPNEYSDEAYLNWRFSALQYRSANCREANSTFSLDGITFRVSGCSFPSNDIKFFVRAQEPPDEREPNVTRAA